MQFINRLGALAVALALVLLLAAPAAADIIVGEAAAGITGSSLMELNADAASNLYASDFTALALLKVNAANGQYTRYVFPNSPTYAIQPGDAKPDAAGNLWWSDYLTSFGRLNLTTLQSEYWDLSSRNLTTSGFAFDASGRLWITQYLGTELIRFNPTSRELCEFNVGGGGDYVISQGNVLWITDHQTGRLLRFDAATNQLRAWALPTGWNTPQGMVLDADGRLWWADSGSQLIGRLTPSTNQAVVTLLPPGSAPVMLALGTEVVWYTDANGAAGFVDPALAAGSTYTLAVATSTVAATNCTTLPAGTVQAGVTTTTGTFSFPAVTWTTPDDDPHPGITRYILPGGDPFARPWGVVFTLGRTWLVDQYRNVLARTPRLPQSPAVTIKLEAGGNRLTWNPVTLDEGGGTVTVASYQVWRSNQPYFRPWDSGVVLAATPGGTNVLDGTLAAPGAPVFYGVRSISQAGLQSRTSAHSGAFAFALVR